MGNMKKIILTFVGFYLPGYKSGGPIRTIANMVDHLGDEFDFRIVTSDRDATDQKPYPNIKIDNWNTVGRAKVFYCSPEQLSIGGVAKIIRSTPHDLVYLNSLFNPTFTIKTLVLRKLGVLPQRPVLLAPRGELSDGALSQKTAKKKMFLSTARVLGLYRGIAWQASSVYEANDIEKVMYPKSEACFTAPDLGPIPEVPLPLKQKERDGVFRLLFLSRISPMKNLDFALRVLARVKVPVSFNIYGPIREPDYWRKCKALMQQLPPNIEVSYRGSVEHSDVAEVMGSHDLFFLPTRGENYGHVIPEALSAGTPVLIANTTPWRGLEKAGVGWDLPLSSKNAFARRIEEFATMERDQLREFRLRAQKYAFGTLTDSEVVDLNRKMFTSLIRR